MSSPDFVSPNNRPHSLNRRSFLRLGASSMTLAAAPSIARVMTSHTTLLGRPAMVRAFTGTIEAQARSLDRNSNRWSASGTEVRVEEVDGRLEVHATSHEPLQRIH